MTYVQYISSTVPINGSPRDPNYVYLTIETLLSGYIGLFPILLMTA